jgi:hypothetical protein
VRDLLGLDVKPARAWPREPHQSGFDNDVAGQQSSVGLTEQMMVSAETVARLAVERLEALVPCDPAAGDARCADAFIADFGARAFRRPLAAADRARLRRVYDAALMEGTFRDGIQLVLEAILQSPSFLYRAERGEGDGATVPLAPHELATRLSFFLVAGPPDAELAAAAAEGRLRTPEDIARQTTRLLSTPAGRAALGDFHRQWLEMDRLLETEKSKARYRNWTAEMPGALLAGMEAFVEGVFAEPSRATLHELLTARHAFVNQLTAPLWGVTKVTGPALRRVAIEHPRAGLLTDVGVMAALAGPQSTNPIARGNFLRERILCQPVPPPPPDLNVMFREPRAGVTVREAIAEHRESPACAGCHALIDPPGLMFESYDAIGRHRATEEGKPIATEGSIVGTRAADGTFADVRALGEHLAGNSDVAACVVNAWFNYAFGRAATDADRPALKALEDRFVRGGGNLVDLVVGIATSETFRTLRRPSAPGVCR